MGLTSFAERRRGDLIVTFRSLQNMFRCDLAYMFLLNQYVHLRGHNYEL